MESEQEAGCVRPTAATAVDGETSQADVERELMPAQKEHKMIHVGQKAPDFSAPGYYRGTFVNDVKLSDHLGKWIVLCFYPGDFTFV